MQNELILSGLFLLDYYLHDKNQQCNLVWTGIFAVILSIGANSSSPHPQKKNWNVIGGD